MPANFIPFINGFSGDSNATLAVVDELRKAQRTQSKFTLMEQEYDLAVSDPVDVAGLSPEDIQKKVNDLQNGPFSEIYNWVGIYSGASMVKKMLPVQNVIKVATTHLHHDVLFQDVLGQEEKSDPRKHDALIRGELGLDRLYIPVYTLDKPLQAHFNMALSTNHTVPVLKSLDKPASMAFAPKTLFCYLPAENTKNPEQDVESQKALGQYLQKTQADHVVLIPSMKTKGYLSDLLEQFSHASIRITDPKQTGLLTNEVLPALKQDATSKIVFPVDSASVCAEVVDALRHNPTQAVMFEGAGQKGEHLALARHFHGNHWTMSLEKGMKTGRKPKHSTYHNAAETVAADLLWHYAKPKF